MEKKIIITALLLGILAIILGAFGAHALKNKLDVNALQSFETGVRYQMYQAFFLLFLATTQHIANDVKLKVLYLVIAGVVFFSGSIYLLSTQAITQIDFKKIGIITPIGGLLLIIAWLIPVYHFLIEKK